MHLQFFRVFKSHVSICKVFNTVMSSLEELKQAAECLERGRRSESKNNIGIAQLGHFFTKIAKNEDASLDGRLLLAQQGIDTARIEQLIESIIVNGNKNKKITDSHSGKDFKPLHSPLNAIQQIEHINDDFDSFMVDQLFKETLDITGYSFISSSPIDTSHEIFPHTSIESQYYKSRARVYARHIEKFDSPLDFLKNSLNALNDLGGIGGGSVRAQRGLFEAMYTILSKCEPLSPNIADAVKSPEGICAMTNGSIEFMQKQYREANFSHGVNVESIEDFVQSKFPDAMAPWAQIWIAIRSGSYSIVPEICKNYRRITKDFLQVFNETLLVNKECTPELRTKLAGEISTVVEQPFRAMCASFVTGLEVQSIPPSVVQTAEDFVFTMIHPARYVNSQNGSGFEQSMLQEVQATIRKEAKESFKESPSKFMVPMLLCLALDFDAVGDELVQIQSYPTEIVHACLALRIAGIWNSPGLPPIVSQFAHLLPPSMCRKAVQYITAAGYRDILIDFILGVDYRKYKIPLDEEPQTLEMLKQELSLMGPCVDSLHITVVCDDLEDSYTILMKITDDDRLMSAEDSANVVGLAAELLKRLREEGFDGEHIILTQRCGFAVAIAALARATQLGQGQRQQLYDECQLLTLHAVEDSLAIQGSRMTVLALAHACKLLTLIEAGLVQDAVVFAQIAPKVIPTQSHYTGAAARWATGINFDEQKKEILDGIGADLTESIRVTFGSVPNSVLQTIADPIRNAAKNMLIEVATRFSAALSLPGMKTMQTKKALNDYIRMVSSTK